MPSRLTIYDDDTIAETCQWCLAAVFFITLIWERVLPPDLAVALLLVATAVPALVTAAVMRRATHRDARAEAERREKSERRVKLMAAVHKTITVNQLGRPMPHHPRDDAPTEDAVSEVHIPADLPRRTPRETRRDTLRISRAAGPFAGDPAAKYEEKQPPPGDDLHVLNF